VARELAVKHSTVVIPGTAFMPEDRGALRVSVSNADRAATTAFAERLRGAGISR
jgi:hypothetical protein